LQGFDRGPNCTGSGKGNELALKPGKRQTASRQERIFTVALIKFKFCLFYVLSSG